LDTVTHTVIGACLGEAIAGKQLGKKAMLYGAVANNLPDIDVVANFWTDHAEGMLVHRGITHSILVAVVFSPLLAWWFQKMHKNSELSFNKWLLLFGSGLFLHIFIDAFTSYGTGWFEPFSEKRISFNALYIVDPLLTIPALISSIGLVILSKNSGKRVSWARNGILLFAFYLLMVSCNKLYVDSVVSRNIKDQNMKCMDYMSTPTPLNNFLWYVIVNDGHDHHVGYFSDLDKEKVIEFDTIKKNDSLLVPFKDTKEVIRLIKFSRGFYCVDGKDSAVLFNDMRFGQIGGWYKNDAPFVFSFNIRDISSDAVALQRGRVKAVSPEALSELLKRAKGK
jgi:inner membrane protein